MTDHTRIRILKVLLRIAGVWTGAAFLTMLLPVEWMAATHEWLGLGEFPRGPVIEYLARSIAALYGFHGVLLLLVSTDPIRYHTIVTYISVLNIVFGSMLVAIDLHVGMPASWTISEGPPIIVFGIVLMFLNRSSGARYGPA
jgi:hypothetical protein